MAVVPPVHLTYHKALKGMLAFVEKVDVSFSTVFIANDSGTEPPNAIEGSRRLI